MLAKWLARVNKSPMWRRPVTVRDMTFSPPTLDRWVALQAHRFGLMGKAEFLFFERSIRPNWHVADVGANQGLYTVYFSRQAAQGCVYAFEPDPDLFAKLKENTQRNGRENVSLFNAAVASQPGKLSLQAGRFNRGDNRIVSGQTRRPGAVEVDAISLDNAVPERKLNLLKVDVQGFEVQVLDGARRLLESNSDLLILLEFWPHGLRLAGHGPEKLLDILHKAGFSMFRLLPTSDCEPFIYRANDWNRPSQFCNLVATRGRNPSEFENSRRS
jgi:FkbM family methyltransferase